MNPDLHFAKRVLIAATMTFTVAAAFAVVVFASSVLATIFIGLLFAVGLRGLGGWIAHRLGTGRTVTMIGVLLALIGAAVGFGALVAPSLAEQAQSMSEQLPSRFEALEDQIRSTSFGRAMMDEAAGASEAEPAAGSGEAAPTGPDQAAGDGQGPRGGQGQSEVFSSGLAGTMLSRLTSSGSLMSGLATIASSALTALAALAVIAAAALYLAFRPQPYVDGFLGMLPMDGRAKARELLDQIAHKLRWWLLGQVTAMGVIGALTGIGLTIVGVPMALALAVLAAVLNFIPNFGPVLSVIPALLFAEGKYWQVLLIYGIAQLLESYVVTPNIQRVAVHLEPVVLIGVQVLMGALFGLPGLIVAAPVLVVASVLLRRLWREDTLEDPAAAPPEDAQPA